MRRYLHSILVLLSALFVVEETMAQTRWDRENKTPPSGRDALKYLSSSSFTARNDEQQQRQQQSGEYTETGFRTIPPPPPPPPPPLPPGSDGRYNPIHYNFENVAQKKPPKQSDKAPPDDEIDEIPQTLDVRPMDQPESGIDTAASASPRYASPRRDAVTRYMSTSKGRALLFVSSATTGAMLGGTLGKSLLNKPYSWAVMGALAFCFAFVLRNPYGELVRALALTLLWAFERSHSVRRRYPTTVHLKALIGAGPRRPFPPTKNPWNYQPYQDDDEDYEDLDNERRMRSRPVEFNMLYSMIAMAFVGSFAGGSLPFIPHWLGALIGAGGFAYSTTLLNARGDLARTLGMRVVALGGQVVEINRELRLLRKTAVVSGRILDKILILDRKHRIKERIIYGANFLYDQAARTAQQIQNQRQDVDERRRGPNDRRDEYERRGDYENRRRNERRNRNGREDRYERRELRDMQNDRYKGREPFDGQDERYEQRLGRPDERHDRYSKRREGGNREGDRDFTRDEREHAVNDRDRPDRDDDDDGESSARSAWWNR